MNCFAVLGIEPTTEKKKIKRAYAAKSREFHPEEHPEEFQKIYAAYEEALAWAAKNAQSENEAEEPIAEEKSEENLREENLREEDSQEEDSFTEESVEEADETADEVQADSQSWDDEWVRQFQNMADVSERQGEIDREIRKIMEQCIGLYLNEKERNKLYHWKDILEEPAWSEYFRTKTFVESWYHFLDTHQMFETAIWQYFQWMDGKLFSASEVGVTPFVYPTQEELKKMPRDENMEQSETTGNPETTHPKVKKERSKAAKVLLYLALLIGTGIVGTILGVIAGTIFG